MRLCRMRLHVVAFSSHRNAELSTTRAPAAAAPTSISVKPPCAGIHEGFSGRHITLQRLSHPRMRGWSLASSCSWGVCADPLLTLANSLPPMPSFARRFGSVCALPAWTTTAAAGWVLPFPLPPSESADDTTASALAVVVQWLAHTPAAPPPSASGRTEKTSLLPGIASRTDRGLMVAFEG